FLAALRNLHKDGLYQYSMYHQADVLSASGVGGGSLIYSNVTIRPRDQALARINLKLGNPEFAAAREWMEGPHGNRKAANRGWLNYVVTKVPVGKNMTEADFVQLGVDPLNPMKDSDGAYVLLDRSRVLRMAAKQVSQKLGVPMTWAPLELALVEYDVHKDTPAMHDSDALVAHTNC